MEFSLHSQGLVWFKEEEEEFQMLYLLTFWRNILHGKVIQLLSWSLLVPALYGAHRCTWKDKEFLYSIKTNITLYPELQGPMWSNLPVPLDISLTLHDG